MIVFKILPIQFKWSPISQVSSISEGPFTMSQYLQYILYGFENSTKIPKSEKNKEHI